MRMIVLYKNNCIRIRLYMAITCFYRALYGFYRAFTALYGFIWLYMGL